MVMDSRLTEFSASMNGSKFDDEFVIHQNRFNREMAFQDREFMDLPFIPPDPNPSTILVPFSKVSPEEDSPEDLNFSDVVLRYISQMLMEEDMEEKTYMFHESLALQAAEKPFYEILGEKYPPSPNQTPLYVDHYAESPDDTLNNNYSNYSSSSSTVDSNWIHDIGEYRSFPTSIDYTSQSISQTPSSYSINNTSVIEGLVESPVSKVQIPDLFSESESVWQFRRGVEEASKFLPSGNNLTIDLVNHELLPCESKEEATGFVVKMEIRDVREYLPNGSRGRKNLLQETIDVEKRRNNKQSAVYSEATLRSEMFDMVLLCNAGKDESSMSTFPVVLQNGASKNGQAKGSNGGKSRGKKQGGKREVDLRTLLIQCAQAVATDDVRSANVLLKQIRQHSSPIGDGNQRLAHYFATGLEARLAGTCNQIYTGMAALSTSAADILKAYHLYLSTCPFKKIANFFSNRTIMNVAENATRLHIIHFGVLYGFQWPCLIQELSSRPGGPPMLRITGIELPQPGFRPRERVEETGRRLADYANSFNVPFEYNAIAQKWETIQIEDLKLDSDEVLVVNSLFRFRNLLDETVVVDSPRNAVLNLIRRMNPDIFILGIVNGTYSAPFFVTRFREVLFHFSSLYDMLETNVPRELEERILIEREIFGREAMNVISCEGSERLNRPETYKQWHVRNLRAGFKQLPLNQDIVKKARDKLKSSYHKDFVIDEDSQWLLQGWKGRIVYALSSWRPA